MTDLLDVLRKVSPVGWKHDNAVVVSKSVVQKAIDEIEVLREDVAGWKEKAQYAESRLDDFEDPDVPDPGCSHPSLDGLAGCDIWVCMSCSRLVRSTKIQGPGNMQLTHFYLLNQIEVKALFDALERRREAELKAAHDAYMRGSVL